MGHNSNNPSPGKRANQAFHATISHFKNQIAALKIYEHSKPRYIYRAYMAYLIDSSISQLQSLLRTAPSSRKPQVVHILNKYQSIKIFTNKLYLS